MANFVYPLYLDRTGRIRTGANTTRVYNDGTNKLGAKFGDTYTFHLYFIDESAATYRLANPSTVKIGVKADGKFDGAVLATGSTSSYPATDADPYVIEVPFTGTGIEDLLNSGDADEDNDVAFIDAMFEVEWTEDAGTTYNSTIDPVGCRIHNDVNKTGDASPDAVPSPDDEWVAHGHTQSLTSGQQSQARANIGVSDESVSNVGDTLVKRSPYGDIAVRDIDAEVLQGDQLIVQTQDAEVETIGKGLVIKSPDGTRWRLTVSNAGAPIFTSL